MDRRASILAVCVAALSASSGCQDYNFNPVGHCLIQPGTKRVTLSDVSTADILFVVDDSGSMAGEQASLANNFGTFLGVLNTANEDRVANGLDAIDFHIAVTTTSVFLDFPPTLGATCRNDCSGVSGSACCLTNGQPQPPMCRPGGVGDCASGFTCRSDCANASLVGGFGCFDATCKAQTIPCPTLGGECGNLQEFYTNVSSCSPWVDNLFSSTDEYPMGRFMADPANASLTTTEAQGTVLHFSKSFYDPATNATALADLTTAFRNTVAFGTCGSGQEQGLEAARLAINRARGVDGLSQTTGYVPGEFLHDKSKLVVVWISDEDDCSSPANAATAVVFPPPPATDGCVADASLPEAQQREYRLSAYADFFTSLGRPFGAAFINSYTNGCDDQSCQPTTCCGSDGSGICGSVCANSTCGGQGVPNRYASLAGQLRGRGVDVVVGSVCDSFGTSLGRIAEIVKPPVGLTLPTQPAAGEVTILRIARPDGSTRKTCRGPAPAFQDPPANTVPMTYAAAVAAGYDWWFTATRDQVTDPQKAPTLATQFVFINHATANCEANPGETYSADYLGQLPPGGCDTADDCASALGGSTTQWICEGVVPGVRKGTCLCN
jgi:hypothetical protein